MGNPADPVSALTGGLANSEGKDSGPGDWIGDVTGSNAAARAAGDAAKARERKLEEVVGTAREGLDAAQLSGRGIVSNAQMFGDKIMSSADSPQELQALTNALNQQERSLGRQAKLFQALDPAVMEASKQALAILRGEETAQSTGIAKRRGREREKLVARLREQLGPGAETSTAGIQALNQFDQETEGLQQGALGQLFGMGQSGAVNRGALTQGNLALGQIGQGFGNRAGRISGATTNAGNLSQAARARAAGIEQGGFSNLLNAQQGLAAGAGSQFVESQLRNQAKNQFINDRIQGAENVAAEAGGAKGCFPEDTYITMADGSYKSIQDIQLGEELWVGGTVTKIMKGLAEGASWFEYRGIKVTGSHAVYDEMLNKWIRVENAMGATPLFDKDEYLYNLSTSQHIIVIKNVLLSDMDETDNPEVSWEESLKIKNIDSEYLRDDENVSA